MSCDYMVYKENDEEKYFPKLYCSIDNKQCIYSKRCNQQMRFIPNGDLWEECYKMIEQKIKDIPKNSYYVQTYRKNKKGKLYLYVVINDKVEKISTELENIEQNYIYIKEGLDGYIVSLIPFEEEKKVYSKRQKVETKKNEQEKRN